MASEIAWAAGLFEGEGAAMVESVKADRPRLSLKMVEETSVRRFAAAVGHGVVYGPYKNRSGEKDGFPRRDFWMWVATGEQARRAAEMLSPLLSAWRLEAIGKWDSPRENAVARG